MLPGTITRYTVAKSLQMAFRPSWVAATILLVLLLLRPVTGFCDLYLQFLVDRSGSMWAPFRGKPKVVQVAEAVERIARDLPPEVAMGLRVYPPPEKGAGGKDPGLLVPLEKENRSRFQEQAERLNPKGRGSLAAELKRALRDFPDGQDNKLLVLVCDGADTMGASFCEKPLDLPRVEGLRFYTVSLNLKDLSEREELDCLGRQMEGKTLHLTPRDDLASTLLPIAKKAHEDEVERQRRVEEEQRRIQELLSKTRLKLEVRNTLDPFFADWIQVDQCALNDEDMPIDTSVRLKEGEEFLLFDRAMAEGVHTLSLRYLKWKDDKAVSSAERILEVRVEEGRTTHVECFPRGALFHWDLACKTDSL
jgi:hypothetical protein